MTTQLQDTTGTAERPFLKWGRVEERVLHHLCPLFLQLPGSSAVTVYDKKQPEHLLWYLVPAFASKVNEPFVVLGVFWFDPFMFSYPFNLAQFLSVLTLPLYKVPHSLALFKLKLFFKKENETCSFVYLPCPENFAVNKDTAGFNEFPQSFTTQGHAIGKQQQFSSPCVSTTGNLANLVQILTLIKTRGQWTNTVWKISWTVYPIYLYYKTWNILEKYDGAPRKSKDFLEHCFLIFVRSPSVHS